MPRFDKRGKRLPGFPEIRDGWKSAGRYAPKVYASENIKMLSARKEHNIGNEENVTEILTKKYLSEISSKISSHLIQVLDGFDNNTVETLLQSVEESNKLPEGLTLVVRMIAYIERKGIPQPFDEILFEEE